jgi:26S proteasome regulatory subunit N13
MNAELMAMLGGQLGPSNQGEEEDGKSILTFKAGKMTHVLQPNGKFLVSPDPRRGELNVVYEENNPVKVEWKDRRTTAVVDSLNVMESDNWTFERIDTGKEGDRVYLLQTSKSEDSRLFFWMQDKEVETDEVNCVEVNRFLSDASEAAQAAGVVVAPATGGGTAAAGTSASAVGGSDDALVRMMLSNNRDTAAATTASGASPTASHQVDALSNILQQMGMPQGAGTATDGTSTLTLADLQGAMAGLATTSPTNPNDTTNTEEEESKNEEKAEEQEDNNDNDENSTTDEMEEETKEEQKDSSS